MQNLKEIYEIYSFIVQCEIDSLILAISSFSTSFLLWYLTLVGLDYDVYQNISSIVSSIYSFFMTVCSPGIRIWDSLLYGDPTFTLFLQPQSACYMMPHGGVGGGGGGVASQVSGNQLPVQPQLIHGVRGFGFYTWYDPVYEEVRLVIYDPKNQAARGYIHEGINQPFARNLASAQDHVRSMGIPRNENKLHGNDWNFWRDFMRKHTSNDSTLNTKAKADVLRKLF